MRQPVRYYRSIPDCYFFHSLERDATERAGMIGVAAAFTPRSIRPAPASLKVEDCVRAPMHVSATWDPASLPTGLVLSCPPHGTGQNMTGCARGDWAGTVPIYEQE
jgi:hypothetical protein